MLFFRHHQYLFEQLLRTFKSRKVILTDKINEVFGKYQKYLLSKFERRQKTINYEKNIVVTENKIKPHAFKTIFCKTDH